MSKINELIQEFCPDGVLYKPMGEIGTFTRGRRFVKDDIRTSGVPCIHYGEMYTHYGVWAYESKSYLNQEIASKLRSAHPGDVIIVSAGETVEDIGNGVAWLGDGDVVIHDACYIFSHNLNPKFVSYFLRTKTFHSQITRYISSGKISSISAKGLEKAIIPIPPLEVQKEIVNILDKFTQLEAELEAELEARRKQYEYYRNQLLSADYDNQKAVSLAEISKKIYSGGTPKTGHSEYWDGGNIPWMSSGEVNMGTVSKTEKYITESGLKNSSAKWVPSNSVVIALAGQGKTRGTVARTRIDLTTNQSLAALILDEERANPDFIFHFLKSQYQQLRRVSSGDGTRGGLNLKMIGEYKVPLPPLTEQNRIVAILDKFDTLINDISEGLPAEINARRKQYEYYRNKLLTFEELHV